jgi:hypothetical protein
MCGADSRQIMVIAEDITAIEKSILIVGEYPILLETRAEVLREWRTTKAYTHNALKRIRSARYDLILFCQTVPNESARYLIAQATELYNGIKVLSISEIDEERPLCPAGFTVEAFNPRRLRDTVATLLSAAAGEMARPVERPSEGN